MAAPASIGWPADPAELIAYLRRTGFRIGVGEALKALALMRTLAAQGRAPKGPEEAAIWLAPIICTSAAQQASLMGHLRNFDRRRVHSEVVAPADDASAPTDTVLSSPAPAAVPIALPVLNIWVRIAIGITLLVLLLAWLGAPPSTPRPSSESAKSIEVAGHADTDFFFNLLAAGCAACVPWLFWILVSRARQRSRAVLKRKTYEGDPTITIYRTVRSLPLFFASSNAPAAAEGVQRLRRALQGLRTHRRVASHAIDVPASVRATCLAAGRPVFVCGWKPRLPDYPLLLESRSPRDHLPVLGRAMSRCLRAEGVHHTVYLFGDDPRWVSTDSIPAQRSSLSGLAARYDHDVLLMVSDGDGLLDQFLGQLEPWVAELASWRSVVLLTPVPQRRWSWRERRLASAGIVVLPATAEGLVLLGDFLRSGARPPRLAFERPPARQTVLVREGRMAHRFHTDAQPSDDDLEEIVEAVCLELPPGPFKLLCFLALFPELRPDLTMHVAQSELLNRPGEPPWIDEAGFSALCALPWLRVGRMPDWLRLALVRRLDMHSLDAARQMYSRWLVQTGVAEAGQPGFGAEIPIEIVSQARDRAVSDAVNNPGSLLRDVIFLHFIQEKPLETLDLEVPDQFVEQVRADQVRTGRWLKNGCIAASGLGALVMFVPQHITGNVFNVLSAVLLKNETWLIFAFGLSLLAQVLGVYRFESGRGNWAGRFGVEPILAAMVAASMLALMIKTMANSDSAWRAYFLAFIFLVPACAMSAAAEKKLKVDLPSLPFPRFDGYVAAGQLVIALTQAAVLYAAWSPARDSDRAFDVWNFDWTLLSLATHAIGLALIHAGMWRVNLPVMICSALAGTGFVAALFLIIYFTTPMQPLSVVALPAFMAMGSAVGVLMGSRLYYRFNAAASCFLIAALALGLVGSWLGVSVFHDLGSQPIKSGGYLVLGIIASPLVQVVLPFTMRHGMRPEKNALWEYYVRHIFWFMFFPFFASMALVSISTARLPQDAWELSWIAAGLALLIGLSMPLLQKFFRIVVFKPGMAAARTLLARGFEEWKEMAFAGAMLVLCISPAIAPDVRMDLTVGLFVMVLWLASRHPPGGIALVVVGTVPLFSIVGDDMISNGGGVAATLVLMYVVITDPAKLKLLLALKGARTKELLILLIGAGVWFRLSSAIVDVEYNLIDLAFWGMCIFGLAGAPRKRVWTVALIGAFFAMAFAIAVSSLERFGQYRIDFVTPLSAIAGYEVAVWLRRHHLQLAPNGDSNVNYRLVWKAMLMGFLPWVLALVERVILNRVPGLQPLSQFWGPCMVTYMVASALVVSLTLRQTFLMPKNRGLLLCYFALCVEMAALTEIQLRSEASLALPILWASVAPGLGAMVLIYAIGGRLRTWLPRVIRRW